MKNKIEYFLIIGALILYLILESCLFDSSAVFSLLAPGEQLSLSEIAHFALFAFLRIFLLLIVPAWLLVKLCVFFGKRHLKKNETPTD